jgi:drug/metabolite transporter (DMT)-like permease
MALMETDAAAMAGARARRVEGILLTACAAALWSLAGYFTRAIEADTMTLLFWRSTLATVWIVGYLALREGRQSLKAVSAMPWQGWLYVGLTGLSMLLFLTSMRHTSIARVSVIYATVPVITALLAYALFRERLRPAAMVAGAFVVVGVIIMSAPDGSGHLSGDLEALGMTIGFALMTIISGRYKAIPALQVTAISTLLTALASLPVARPAATSATDLVLISLFALTALAIAPVVFFRGARLLAPAETSLVGTIETPLAPLWVWLAFGETPTGRTLIGGLIVMAAVIGYLYTGLRRQKAATQP